MSNHYNNSQRKSRKILLILKVTIRSYKDVEPPCCQSQKLAVLYA
jgi:hypothetical protein